MPRPIRLRRGFGGQVGPGLPGPYAFVLRISRPM